MSQSPAKKYVPNLRSLHTVCELNYVQLLKLLPEVEEMDLSYRFGCAEELTYVITILDFSRYTTTIEIKQVGAGLPEFMKPCMQVRLYHDARMAEVVASQHVSGLQPSYSYPNKSMYQKNEKEMVNIFLAEWLYFCIQQRPIESTPS